MAYCPRPSVTEALRNVLPPGVFGFFVACKGPLSTVVCTRSDLCMEGCTAEQAFIPVQIKWNDVVNQGWIAPGGNRYWKTSIPATASDPRAVAVLRMLAGRSATAFVEIWGRDTTRKMTDVMAAGAWVAKLGIMSVPVLPQPNETPAAFVARGGYLLDLRPGFSPILGNVAWQKQGASLYPWLKDIADLRTIELYGNYDANAGLINYTLRCAYTGSWDQTVNAVSGAIANAATGFCGKLAENVGAAVTVSTTFPVAKPYMSVYTAALTLCNLSMAQIPPVACVPREPRPEDLMALVSSAKVTWASAGGKGAIAAQVPGLTTPLAVNPNTPAAASPPAPLPPTPPSPGGYPAGTIAWRDPATPGYDIAIPAPVGGVTHQVVAMGVTTLPAGLHVVDRGEWERATLPWFRRRTAKIGMAVAGVALAAGATFAVAHTAA